MRHRSVIAVVLAAAVAAAMPAGAATKKKPAPKPKYPVLDGRSHKKLTFTATPAQQDHDADFVTSSLPGSNDNRTGCRPPRCYRYTFQYRPAKGVRPGAVSAKVAWTVPADDMDLYVAEGDSTITECGASAGTSETVRTEDLVPGHVYTIVVDFYRVTSDTATGYVSFPATDTPAAEPTDKTGLPVGCAT